MRTPARTGAGRVEAGREGPPISGQAAAGVQLAEVADNFGQAKGELLRRFQRHPVPLSPGPTEALQLIPAMV